jgi:uncharacterized phage-associated protein
VLLQWLRVARQITSHRFVKRKVDISTRITIYAGMHDSRTVANEIVRVAEAHGHTLTPMQLLKLTYIAHGWSLGLYSNPLISDQIQAWEYGPVIPTLYSAIKDFRDRPVHGPIQGAPNTEMTAAEKKLVRQVVEIYGGKSGPALSRLTHAAGTPWEQVYEPGSFGIPIPNDIIEDHYQQLAEARG